MDKATLRKKYIERRATLTSKELELKSLAIANQTLNLPIWEKTYYHLFLTMEDKKEVNTEYLINIIQGKHKNICVPVMKENTKLEHILLQRNMRIKLTGFGVPEPIEGVAIPTEKIDVVFVPLLAYDINGNRTGYGKGFYDRFLAETKEDTLFIGLSFFEPEEEIPSEVHDIPLDYCLTPNAILHFTRALNRLPF